MGLATAKHYFGLLTISCALNLIAGETVQATTYTWNQPAFGVYNFNTPWSPQGIPNSNDTVIFGNALANTLADQTILFVESTASQFATIVSGNHTFQFANPNETYTLQALEVGKANSTLGLPSTAKLTINIDPFGFPGTLRTVTASIGAPILTGEIARPGVMILTGANNHWDNAGTPDGGGTIVVGGGGSSGQLEIRDGARLHLAPEVLIPDGGFYPSYLGVGGQSNRGFDNPSYGDGVLIVNAPHSSINAEGGLWLGSSGHATCNVEMGGFIQASRITFGSIFSVGTAHPGIGRLNVSGDAEDNVGNHFRSTVRTRSVGFNDPNSVIDIHDGGIVEIEGSSAITHPHYIGAVYLDATGTFTGTGTIIGKFIMGPGARYSPGNSPGTLNVTGDFEMQSGSTLNMEIAGASSAANYDQIIATGGITLNGVVNLSFVNGFVPHAGDHFELFKSPTFNSSQANFNLLNLPAGLTSTSAFVGGIYSLDIAAVPEPSTLVLAIVVAAMFPTYSRQRRKR